jgi:hypothetical protein
MGGNGDEFVAVSFEMAVNSGFQFHKNSSYKDSAPESRRTESI